MNMKRRIVIFVLGSILYLAVIALLFFVCGCDMLAQLGADPNETNLLDPNQVNVLVSSGHAVQAIGVATGNPKLIGIGILLVTIAGTFGGVVIKNRLS